MSITTPNSALENSGGQTPLYDDANHQVVAARAKNITTDSATGIVSGDIGVDVEVSISQILTNDGTFATQTTAAAMKSDLDTIVTNTNKIPASPAQEGGNLSTLAGIVSGGKAATKAASGDFAAGSLVDLATLLTLAGTPSDANSVNSLMGRLTKLRDLLNSVAYDNTNEVKVSLYGKNSSAGDTALLLDALGQMTIEQFITYQIMAGHGFRVTTGLIATGAGSNNYVGIQAIVNNITKNVLFYAINGVSGSGAASQDTRLYTNNLNTADGALTTNLLTSIKNQQPASATVSSLSALWGSPASTTQTGSFVGTQVEQDAIVANAVFNPLADGSFVWFKAGDVGSLAYYVRVTATTNQAACNLKWIEW